MKRNLSGATTELILHGNLFRAILAIAVPVVVTSFLQTLYNLTDTYWLGQIGTEPWRPLTWLPLCKTLC